MKRQQLNKNVKKIIILAMLLIIVAKSQLQNFPQNHSQHPTLTQSDRIQQILPYHILPVYGNASLGYYYANIFVGSPNPQPQSVIVDTGSGILAMPCANCKSCGHQNHINPPYDTSKSSTSRQLTCNSNHPICADKCRFKNKQQMCMFSIHYAEGSTLQGTLVEDEIRLQTIGKNQQIRTAFGCTQKQTKLFFQQKANGIFGLAPKRQSNLLQELFNRHSLINNEKRQFSLCLAPNGGLMTVGGVHQKLHPTKLQPDVSIPFNDNHNLYSLNGVREISIGQMFITSIVDRIGGYGIFIDSGATFSYIPENKYVEVQRLLNTTCIDSKRCKIGRGQDSMCYKLDLKQGENLYQQLNKLFPAIEINIQNKALSWAPTKYMMLRQFKRNQVCMGLQPLNRYLLGANWMTDRNIVFDLNQKMIHIYDNVQCVENSSMMSHYTNLSQNNPQISYIGKEDKQSKGILSAISSIVNSDHTQNTAKDTSNKIIGSNGVINLSNIKINTKSLTFILGIICLVFAILIGCVLGCHSKNKNKDRNSLSKIQTEEEQLTDQNKGGNNQTDVHNNSNEEAAQVEKTAKNQLQIVD